MSKLKLIILTMVVAAAAAVLWLQHLAIERLRGENEVLKAAIAERKELAQDDRSSATGQTWSQEESDELLKLRSEVTRLREQTNEIGALAEANQKLAELLKISQPAKKKGPEDALPQDIHPKSSWTFHGYGSPDDAFESMLWSAANGDMEKFLAGMTPELREKLEKRDDSAILKADSDRMLEFRILDRQVLADDVVRITYYVTRKAPGGDTLGSMRNTFLKRINGEWRIADSASAPQ